MAPDVTPSNEEGGERKGIAGTLLARDKVDRYRPLGAFGKPAYQSHVQLRALLLAKLGPRYANYFAKPNYDADTGELRWTSEVPGTARGWQEMAPEEQAQRALDLEVVRSRLASYAEELRTQGGTQAGGSQAFASLLDQALKVPTQGDFLYFVGDQPVIAFWGFETQTGGSVDPAAVAPRYGMLGTTEQPLVAPTAAADKRKRPWWWWLLWALLALLLLLALLFALRACTPDEVPVTPAEEPKPPVEEIKPPVEEPKPPVEEPKPPVEEPKPPVEEVKPPVEKPKPIVEEKKPRPEKREVPDTKRLKPKQELQIPPGALERGDLSFLEGLWQLGDDRLNEYRGRPDNVVATNRTVFDLRGDGSGRELEVERRDARTGADLPSKTARVRVHTDGKRLYIDKEGGLRYQCEVVRNGRTHCYIVNPDGVKWDAPLRRLQ